MTKLVKSLNQVIAQGMSEMETHHKWLMTTPEVIFKQTAHSTTKPNYLKVRLGDLWLYQDHITFGSSIGKLDSARYLDERVREKLDSISNQIVELQKEWKKVVKKEYATLEEVTIEDVKKVKELESN